MSEFKQAIDNYAKYVIQQAKSNLSKGKNNASKQLYNSLDYKVKQNRSSGGRFATGYNVEFLMEDYGIYQDKGVHGAKSSYVENRKSPFRYKTKQPPIKAFDKWIKIKGIKGRDKKTGRFITDQSLKFLIARSIKNKGIRASMFFTKPFEAGIKRFGDDIAVSYGNDVLKELVKKMSTIIRTRSPFFIRTPQEADANLSYFQINITVFGGLSSSTEVCDDLYATYSLQKKPLGAENSVSFDISEIVNDHIEQIFTGTYASAKSSIWVTVATSARQADGTVIGSVTTNTYLAQEGFNKFKEGVNYTTEPIAMMTGTHFEYHKGSTLTIPVNVERVSQVEYIGANGITVGTDTFTDNGNQNQKIQYSQFANTTVKDVARVKVTYDTTSFITILTSEIEECKYPVNKITFVNRWGALQDLFFFKKSTESLDATRENFNASIFEARAVQLDPPESGTDCQESLTFNTYSTTAHAKKTFNANATESIVLNTGFVNELMNPYFEELMVSEYIWLTDSSANIFPVNLKESSFAKKTGLNDRLINYTMSFEKSFSLVNNIR